MAFTLRLPDDLDEALTAKSSSTGVPKAVLVRRAIERELGIGAPANGADGAPLTLPSAPAESTFRPDFKKG